MRIAVLGATGLVGAHLRRSLGGLGDVVGTYHTSVDNALEPLDVRDAAAVRDYVRRQRPDLIVAAAADPYVDRCEIEPEATRAVNVAGLGHVVDAARDARARVIYLSSDYVFDGNGAPYHEDDPVHPINEYGRQKVDAERLVASLDAHLICRFSGVFGWETRRRNFVCQVVDRLRRGESFAAASDQTLCPTYAVDLADAVRDLVTRGVGGTVHVVGPDALVRADFAREVARVFGLDASKISAVPGATFPSKTPRPANSSLSDDRLRAVLGRSLRHSPDALAHLRDAEPAAVAS
ncbi:MAG TPA: NAD(P)-dependent oxidoreductase [Candidatus Acidoferrales bacterium]|nr:NAD(P)-dependent oxidoreductase [Candidatus Acidoferrales bacterium]